ncbi:hypothetical protein HU200_051490 [Digitaria exilis]|uniref:Uncharacterized protein n=1 Tax=Digitaria exilis TaxID=1010633 RepID=A0A835AQ44_9POAL|nr:hypothetical protein HU200_051490 [Digitaria exilis]
MPGYSLRCFSSNIVYTLLLSFLLAPPAAAQLPWTDCGDSGAGVFTQNSTYQSNLGLASTIFPRKASSSASLFAAGSIGAAPDVVYVLSLCRGDVNASTCAESLGVAFQDAQQLCAYSKDVFIYYDLCYLRFSSLNFLAGTDNDQMYLEKTENVSAPTAAFDAAVGALLNATAERAAADPIRRFATGEEASGGSVPAIYALVQCTPDMSPAACRSCLANITQMAPKVFSGSPSGRYIRVRCNYRYELYRFFSGSPLVQLPALASPAPQSHPRVPVPAASSTSPVNGPDSASIIYNKTPMPKSIEGGKCAVFDLLTLQVATDNFHDKNKLGEGGFGTVYKGKLSDGQKIAVKKLSRCTRQALSQLHNEVKLLAELQHIKLVRLLGFCSDRDEMMLVYEHINNGSLDRFLFGIAKGILYLHEDSSIRIIHRDLKSNNILLDENMNPKIADFGLAKLLGGGHTQTKTASVAGTYGYMAPEYALFGEVSPKIDVFSFGVLVLEIIIEKRNTNSDDTDKETNLLTDVWNCWTKGYPLQLVNKPLDRHTRSKLQRCIHIALLCVQENPDDRPSISSVVVMLTRSRVRLQPPRQPAFYFGRDSSSIPDRCIHGNYVYEKYDVIVEDNFSVNDVTNTDPDPR